MKNPFILPLAGIAGGIMLCAIGAPIWLIPALTILFLGVLLTTQSFKIYSLPPVLRSFCWIMCFAAAGTGIFNLHNQLPGNHLMYIEIDGEPMFTAEITQWLKQGDSLQSALIKVTAMEESTGEGKAIAYFPAGVPLPGLGTRFAFQGTVSPVNANSGYGKYLQNQQVFHRFSIENLTILGEANSFWARMARMRMHLAQEIKALMPNSTTADFAIGLLLGDKSGLDRGTRQDFSAAGISHVLAISGLHVGIIYYMLVFLIGKIWMGKRTLIIRNALILLILWSYALLIGLQPAVVRAVFLITLFLLANAFHLRVARYNLLAFAATIILIFSPNLLFHAGFQLSFCAVLGIFTLTKPIQRYLNSRARFIPQIITEALAVSLAAQIFTTPISIAHFGSFPTYFLISNLLITLPAWAAINLGFIGLVTIWIPGVRAIIFELLDRVLWVMEAMGNAIGNLPGAVVQEFSINDLGMRILCVTVLMILGLLHRIELLQTLQFFKEKTVTRWASHLSLRRMAPPHPVVFNAG